ncbi:MAG: ankyrin repeat domain-containing protein [archaeon]|nr:ankyrin repeat domain-containing protein [archaeon]
MSNESGASEARSLLSGRRKPNSLRERISSLIPVDLFHSKASSESSESPSEDAFPNAAASSSSPAPSQSSRRRGTGKAPSLTRKASSSTTTAATTRASSASLLPESALCDALLSHDFSLLFSLLESPALTHRHASHRGFNGYSLMHMAVLSQNQRLLQQLFLHPHFSTLLEATCSDGRTPLHLAAELSLRLVEMLLAAGARVDSADSLSWTPLFAAANAGKLEVFAHLLEAGASPRHLSQDRATVLHYLVRVTASPSPPNPSSLDRLEMLIRTCVSQGCPINQLRANGETVLASAVEHDCCPRISNLLLELGANAPFAPMNLAHFQPSAGSLSYHSNPSLMA